MVIWIIGLSAAGKTTIAREVCRQWRQVAPNVVLVDGDELRDVFATNTCADAHDLSGRRRNADRICALCQWLDRQEMHVVCSILSVFEQSRQWNREHLKQYFEVYVAVPMEVLRLRETKGLYAAAAAGTMKNVAGVDLPFDPPSASDLIIDNSADRDSITDVAAEILAAAHGERPSAGASDE